MVNTVTLRPHTSVSEASETMGIALLPVTPALGQLSTQTERWQLDMGWDPFKFWFRPKHPGLLQDWLRPLDTPHPPHTECGCRAACKVVGCWLPHPLCRPSNNLCSSHLSSLAVSSLLQAGGRVFTPHLHFVVTYFHGSQFTLKFWSRPCGLNCQS